jgi:hypothetical protein
VALRVQHVSHLEQLKVAAQFGRDLGLGQVEPVGARSGFFVLCNCQ